MKSITVYKPHNKIFNSRKEAKDYLGASAYKMALKYGDIEIINYNNDIADSTLWKEKDIQQ